MHDRPLEHRPHPWHGVDPGKHFPEIARAYIEIVPTDGVKYKIDKHSGYLMVDRPQRFSTHLHGGEVNTARTCFDHAEGRA